jgi:radical SAM superfamily enzyme YgiQ (UPF0313 family)
MDTNFFHKKIILFFDNPKKVKNNKRSPFAYFVNFMGYPYDPTSFCPDNGLAGLVELLYKNNIRAKILDYGTPTTVRRLTPNWIRVWLDKFWDIYIDPQLREGKKRKLDSLAGLKFLGIMKYLKAIRWLEIKRIANEISQEIAKNKVNIIGFKLWNGDGLPSSIRIAEILKSRFPHLKIIGGGPHVDLFKEEIFKITNIFDGLVYGEGEVVITDLIEKLTKGFSLKSLPNLIFKDGNKVVTTALKRVTDLNELPLGLYEQEVYPSLAQEKINFFVYEESRGCSYGDCSFCFHPEKSGKGVRIKSPDKIVKELLTLQKQHQAIGIKFAGSNSPYHLLAQVAKKMTSQNIYLPFTVFGEARNSLNIEQLKIMKAAGLDSIFFGVESANQKILTKMQKGQTASQIAAAFHKAKMAQIKRIASIIFPAPGETLASKRETLRLLFQLEPESICVQPTGLFPQTQWYKEAFRYGFVIPRPERLLLDLMTYKIELLKPLRYWKEFPYLVDGKPWQQVVTEFEDFMHILNSLGLTTSLTGEHLLFAQKMKMQPFEFAMFAKKAAFTGNANMIEELIYSLKNKP